MLTRLTSVVALLIAPLIWLAAAHPAAAGQAAGTRPSVWEGVYTAAQAGRGHAAYDAACSACHGRDLKGVRDNRALAGERFWQDWGEDSLGTLFSVVRRTMPRPAPGSLPEDSYLDIVAYLLQQNGYPEGGQELTTAAVDGIWVMRKEGPGPVPNFSLVWVVGCLAEESPGAWTVTHASEPAKTRNPEPSEGTELERSTAAVLGSQTFGLMDLSTKHTVHAGKRVEAKGLLIRGPRSKLNPTSLQPLPGTCPP